MGMKREIFIRFLFFNDSTMPIEYIGMNYDVPNGAFPRRF